MNAAEAWNACRALGNDPATCDEKVAGQSLGGQYCDGTIVIDASGRRCVPRVVLDARRKLEAPGAPAPPFGPSSPWWPWLVAAGFLGILIAARAHKA